MIIKTIEIRDAATFIPAAVIQTTADSLHEARLLHRAGWHPERPGVILMRLGGLTEAHHDPAEWANKRTMPTAHRWLADHFDEVKDGDVVDVEFILGETSAPKISEVSGG